MSRNCPRAYGIFLENHLEIAPLVFKDDQAITSSIYFLSVSGTSKRVK